MKIKNLKCYLLGAMLIVNSSFMLSCDAIEEAEEARKLDDFLNKNNITRIADMEDMTLNFYEAEVAEHTVVGDEIVVTEHYEKLDRIDNVICQGREYDYDYKVLKIEGSDGKYEIDSMVVEDINSRPSGYDYVYPDDYVIENGYSDVLIRYGKILKR